MTEARAQDRPASPLGAGVRTGSTWRQRLGTYLIGVAIGCVLLGMIWNARAQRQAAARQQQQAVQGATAPEGGAAGVDAQRTTTPSR